jgi:hypothetical protein
MIVFLIRATRWSRCESVKMTGARVDETVRFFLADMQGSILPGCSKDFTFTFVSHASGSFVEEWEVRGPSCVLSQLS